MQGVASEVEGLWLESKVASRKERWAQSQLKW